VKVLAGEITMWEAEGYMEKIAVGNGKLALVDPAPAKFPHATVQPSAGDETVIEVQLRSK
jgi:hypothetical protein